MTLVLTPTELRAHVARAARRVTPTWPLSSFIAVNPVSKYEHLPFGEHADLPRGVAFTRSEHDYQVAHRAGEITVAALRQSLRQTIPQLVAIAPLIEGGRSVTAADIAVAELLSPRANHEPDDESDTTSAFDQVVSKWLAVLLGAAVWSSGSDNQTLYRTFHRLARHDRTLPAAARRRLTALPDAPEATILHVLNAEGLHESDLESIATAELDALPGWSSHLAWQAARSSTITLTDYVALRVALHYAFAEPLSRTPALSERSGSAGPASVSVGSAHSGSVRARQQVTAHAEVDADQSLRLHSGSADHRASVAQVRGHLDESTRRLVWQTAAEVEYRTGLLHALENRRSGSTTPSAQFMFCIDTRSEGYRRHLEDDPQIETFGFAGFFAASLHYRPWEATDFREHYPALLSGGVSTTETAAPGAAADRRRRGLFAVGAATRSSKSAGSTPVAAFSWAETAGWVSGVAEAARTFFPRRSQRIADWFGAKATPPIPTTVDICERLSVQEQTELAEAALRMMGLTEFAPLVVVTGHRSTTRNNLYQAALDCGACGGNGGGANARAAAAIFNNPPVRLALADRGLPIPETTWFVGAEHDTANDKVALLDPHLVPERFAPAVTALDRTLATAADALTRERARALPGADARPRVSHIRKRADDWAEMYPELGLAGNASIVIGPRSISRCSDLGRRAFLHSYEASADPDGSGLAAIMTAPLIVSQWINHQYYFSTLNPQQLGAGNKTLHNPIHDLGVLAGQTGDLKIGLPWQSVAAGTRLLHTPLRLSVFIQAPLERIGQIISATDTLRNLLDNQWISLHARADSTTGWSRYTAYGFATNERTTHE